jgi:hypothetical protein
LCSALVKWSLVYIALCQAKLKRSIGLSYEAKIGLTRVAVEEGEEEEEGDSGERGDQIHRVVAGTNLRRWKHERFRS